MAQSWLSAHNPLIASLTTSSTDSKDAKDSKSSPSAPALVVVVIPTPTTAQAPVAYYQLSAASSALTPITPGAAAEDSGAGPVLFRLAFEQALVFHQSLSQPSHNGMQNACALAHIFAQVLCVMVCSECVGKRVQAVAGSREWRGGAAGAGIPLQSRRHCDSSV